MIKTVYTYYEPIDAINNCSSRNHKQEELIEICAKSWEKNDWELIVLNYDKAKEHPYYQIYSGLVKTFPSVNPPPYDYHCYMRWLAMAQVGGGLMIDYDVINTSFKNQDSEFLAEQKHLSVLQNNVPCVVYGSSEQYLKVCEKFCELINYPGCVVNMNNKPHTSDMIMLAVGFSENDINKLRYVVDYPNNGPLVHCSQRFCSENKTNKLEAMTNILTKRDN